jgi:RNA-directed DNA polymerase
MPPLSSGALTVCFSITGMTAAGYRVTRWADDFVVVCRTRQEAQTALALAESFLRDELGVSLHPEKTPIVHVDHGFEFRGYKGAA